MFKRITTEKTLLVLIILLSVPAFFMYLGLQPLIPDEAIRALVAQEMLFTGDYLTPTLGGDLYLKKPPLYNWIIALSFRLSGQQNEFFMRLPMLVFLFLFTLSIYLLLRHERGKKQATLVALLFLSNGRVLFYESLHGLIDIAFSWLVFLFFIITYQLFHNGKYLRAYLLGWLIIAMSYLMKGLPSLVFAGFTFLVLHAMHGKLRLLIGIRHMAGVALFVFIVGGYYWAYFTQNPVEPTEVFRVLLGETTRRTALRFGWWAAAKNLLLFPFNMTYHFLPWSLLALLLFNKSIIKSLWDDPFLRYTALLIIFNIIPYWTSPEVHPRYILMFVPLFLTLVVAAYDHAKAQQKRTSAALETIFGGMIVLLSLLAWTPMFVAPTKTLEHTFLTSLVLSASLGFIAFAYHKMHAHRLLWLVITLLVLRIGLNLTVLPARALLAQNFKSREVARQTAELTRGTPLFIWWNPEKPLDPYYGRKRTAYAFMFYANAQRNDRMVFSSVKREDAFYVARKSDFSPKEAYVVHRLWPAEEAKDLFLIRFFPHAVE